jgi:Tol biopolymer transport system component
MTDEVPPSLAEALRERYAIEHELGRGGMATVYLARDLRHDRPVALKLLRPDLSAILGSERFLREIQVTAKLQHPHILTLIDSGSVPAPAGTASFLYYVLPYVDGESLRARLQREGQLSMADTMAITRGVAAALGYAHAQGVVHRDIKPENILLHAGEAMVADFGIALAASSAGRERLTETGLSLGTPAYMSPEQATAEPRLDARSDQYSLACVVYEMLAGEPPYTGPTAQAIIAKRLSEPIPHLSSVRQVPPGIEAAITRALARVPSDRFASVGEFAAALERPAARVRPGRRWVAALGGAVLVLGIAALATRWRSTPLSSATHRQITFTGRATAPALSPDHRWLAYVSGHDLLVQELASQAPPVTVVSQPLSGNIEVPLVRWSPDGSRLFYVAADSQGWAIHSVDRQGGAPRRLGAALDFDLTRTGDAMYGTSFQDTLFELEPQSGVRRRAFSVQPVAASVYSLAVSPDGRWLAFTGVKGSVTLLGLCRTDGSQLRRLVEDVPRAGSLAWNEGSDAIYYLRDLGNGANMSAAGDVMKLRISPRTGEPKGNPGVMLAGTFVQEFSLSSDGRQLAYTKVPPQQKLWTMTLDGPASHPTVQARELSTGTSIYGTPDISRDGKWVAFARNDGGAGNLYITPFDHFEPRPLVVSPGDEWSPRWSPSGREIAFAGRDAQSRGILVADVVTGQVRRVSRDGLAPLGMIAWMPSGREVVFPLDLGNHYAIQNIVTGQTDTLAAPPEVASFHLTVPSPDGQLILVNTYTFAPFRRDLWSVERSGQPRKRYGLFSRFQSPLLWTDDGWIYFMSEKSVLFRVRAEGGPATQLATLPQPCSFWQTALSHDARRLVCTVSHTEPDIWLAENFDPER